MKKRWLSLSLALIMCLGLLSGCKDGWTPPPEPEATSDITLSGSKWNGKVAVTMVLHPDGTLDIDMNDDKSQGTWDTGTGDVAMVAHIVVKGNPVDINVVETDDGYSAEFTPVPDFFITGKKGAAAPKDITLSGSKWNGKVVTTLVLHPDGTVDTDLNGEQGTGTWEVGNGDIAMVAHITVKGEPVDVEIIDEGEIYSAVFTPVPDFVITGKKDGSAAVPAPTEEPAPSDTPTQEPAPSDTPTPAGESTPVPGPTEFPENSLVLDFTPDISEKLRKMFYVESSTWGPALGASGSYTPTESADELFAWTTTGSSTHLTFYANGTYKYEFTTMNIEETGAWTWESWKMTVTTAKGTAYTPIIKKGDNTAPAPTTAPTTEPTPSPTTVPTAEPSAAPTAGGTAYTTQINGSDVTIIVAANQKSVTVNAMGMKVEGSCEVKDNVLTLKDQTSGNAQIWASLGKNSYVLNADGTAVSKTADDQQPSGSKEKTYTTQINGSDVTIIVADNQKSVTVNAMGMKVEGSCEIKDNVLIFKDQTSGNAQIWASLGKNSYILNDDGTAVIKTADEQQSSGGEEKTASGSDTPADAEYPKNSLVLDFTPDISEKLQKTFYVESGTWGPALGASGSYTPTESADELFAWTTTGSSTHLTMYANGTYKYEFTTMKVEETGTWTFEGYKMTLTTPKGAVYQSIIAK